MITPDTLTAPNGTEILFVRRWNILVSALIIDPSIKLVARTAVDYGLVDGEGIYPGNERIARETGLGDKAVREAWHFMRGAGMATRDIRSMWTGRQRTADTYQLVIPGNWRGMPLLGPQSGRFTCQECGKLFNPQPCNMFAADAKGRPVVDPETGDRQVRWRLYKATFCHPPRDGPSCFDTWQRANVNQWANAAWGLFGKARNDDWLSTGLPVLSTGTGTQYRQLPVLSTGTPGTEYRQLPVLSTAQL